MSGTISFSGISSGIDFDSMIEELVEAEKYQANNLEDWQTEWEDKITLLEKLQSKMTSLQSAMDSISTRSGFVSRTGASSNSDVAVIAVDSTASTGSYSLEVATATKHIVASMGFDTTSEAALEEATEYFTIDANGESITVDGAGVKSLQDICDEINAGMSTVTATIVNDGSSEGAYRLYLTSTVSGSDGAITITQVNTDLFDNGMDGNVESIDDVDGTSTYTPGVAGAYTGAITNRYVFEVTNGGTVGSNDIEITWTDTGTGQTGTFTVTDAGTYDVTQGIQLTFNGGNKYKKTASFSLDVYASEIQAARDSGLALAEKEVHSGFSDADTTAVTTTNATFSYSYAGNQVFSLNVSAGTTLQGLADIINEDPDNPGVKATIINDGSGSANSYHLVLTGKDTGAAYKIDSIDYSSFSSGAFKNGAFSETQKAANAMVKLDGYPSGDQYVQSASNLITDLIDGASISLKSSGNTEFTIENDNNAMIEKVQTYVDAYNEVLEYIDEITEVVYDDDDKADSDSSGLFVGNYSIYTMESQLKSFLITRATAFDDTAPYLLLTQVGLSLSEDNVLELDEEDFTDALNDNDEAVFRLFTADKIGVTTNANVSYASGVDSTEAGKYHFKIVVGADGKATSGLYWEDGQTEADGLALTIDKTGYYLTAMSGSAKGMALQISGLVSNTTLEGNVNIKSGKAQEFADVMDGILNSDSGSIQVLLDSYEDIIDGIQDKIDKELKRVDQVEARYTERFANLETALSEYESVQDTLDSMLSQLESLN